MKFPSSIINIALLASSSLVLVHATAAKSSEGSGTGTGSPGPSSTPTGSSSDSNGTGGSSGSEGGTFNGRFTWYDVDVGAGACGEKNTDESFTVALNKEQYGEGYPGPNCFKKIKISFEGKSHDATIADMCPGCPYGALDLSPALFKYFADPGTGVINGEWSFAGGSGSSSNNSSSTDSGSGSGDGNGEGDDNGNSGNNGDEDGTSGSSHGSATSSGSAAGPTSDSGDATGTTPKGTSGGAGPTSAAGGGDSCTCKTKSNQPSHSATPSA